MQIGTGHLMRCLAQAQAWKDSGGEVAFITTCQMEELGLLDEFLPEAGYKLKMRWWNQRRKLSALISRLWFLSMWHEADNVRAPEGNHHYKQGGNHGNFYAYKPNKGGI